jgi:aspartate/methionine/tyrosine aminotransferase
VLVTAGASEANACVFFAMLSAGDEVLVESPGYEPHRAVPRLIGARVATFERPEARGFSGFAEGLERALRPTTRLVVISHLHNPSGAPLAPEDIETLDRLAERHGFWVLCDETFRDASSLPLGTLAAGRPRWISTSSLTKSYGLGGLRIGWVAGAPEVLERCEVVQNALSVIPSSAGVALALALGPHLDRLRARTHTVLDRNRARWLAALAQRAQAAGGVVEPSCPVPSQGTTTWCRFGAEGKGDEFAEFVLARFDLAVTPGRFFGDSRGIRVGLGAEEPLFSAAMAELERALAEYDAVPSVRAVP